MTGFLGDAYLWVKALHVIVVIFWMAGMFMMPRFFAYHAEEIVAHGLGSPTDLAWRARERRLMRIIINPSMVLVWLFGLMLATHLGWDIGGWLWLKLALVTGLAGLHGFLARWRRAFADGRNVHSTRFFRMMNEIPTLATIPVVILVIVRPF